MRGTTALIVFRGNVAYLKRLLIYTRAAERGHSSLHAALDAAISITKEGDQFRWSIAKSKDGRDDKVSSFRLDNVVLRSDEDGEIVTSCVIKPDAEYVPPTKPLSPSARQMVDAYQAVARRQPIGEGGRTTDVRLQDWREAFYQISTSKSQEGKRKTFERGQKELLARGDLSIDGEMNRLTLGVFSDLPMPGLLQEAIAGVARLDSRTGSGHVPDMSKGR